MKKLLSILVLTLMGLSLMANPIDPQFAAKVAKNFVAQRVKVAEGLVPQIVYTHPMPKSGLPAMYAVNVGSAFVIVAADDVAHPILGYSLARPWPTTGGDGQNATRGNERSSSENGERVAATLPQQVADFLNDLAAQIEAATQAGRLGNGEPSPTTPDPDIATEWQRLLGDTPLYSPSNIPDSVGPLLTTTWDQGQYYNSLCPEDAGGPDGHVLTGCVATAMAQIINYWGYPIHGRGSHSLNHSTYGTLTVNYDNATYDFDNMPDALTGSSTPEQVEAVAKLMYDCGVAVNMKYGADGSGTYNHDVRAALTNHFNYLASSNYADKVRMPDDEWVRTVSANIRAGLPVLYSGISGQAGHMFVCDGVAGNYFHFNFGWSGNGDGWYLSSAVNPGMYEFNTNQAALLDIAYDTTVASNTVYTQYNKFQHSYFNLSEPIHLKGIMDGNNYSYISYALYDNYEDSSYVTFYPLDTNNQVTLYMMDELESEAWIYDGETTDTLLRAINDLGGFFDHVDRSPVSSTRHALTIAFAHGNMSKGNHFLVVEDEGCQMVTGLSATSDTSVVHLQWDSMDNCIGWQVEYGLQGFVPGTGIIISVDSNRVDITGLNKRNKYDFYVRAVCDENLFGPWCAPLCTTVERLLWVDVVSEQPEGYTVENDGSITISSAEGLAWLARQSYLYDYIDDTVRIAADIDLGEYLWLPIYEFRGVFDGGGHTIRNLTSEGMHVWESFEREPDGLIRTLNNGMVKDVNLIDCYIYSEGFMLFGGIVDYAASSKIYNCMVDGLISGYYAGCIASRAQNTEIVNCASFGKVIAYNYSSGICGEATDCVIRNCHSSVEPVSRTHFASAICSSTPRTEVANCYGNYYKSGNYNICALTNESFTEDNRYYFKHEREWVMTSVDFWTNLPYEDSLLFEDGYHRNLVDVLNKGVEKYNIAGLRLWVADSTRNGLPVLGDVIYEPVCQNIDQVSVRNIMVDGVPALELSFGDDNADHYEVKYGILYDEATHLMDSARYATLYSNPDTLFLTEPGNDYLIYVRAFCDSVQHGAWSDEIEHVFDKPYWTDIVTSQPEGYSTDAQGNVAISSTEGLAWLCSVVNGLNGQEADKMVNKKVSLLADVNLGAYKWKPISAFGGTFDGYGHTINSLYAYENTDSVGFFASVFHGEVRDLRMTNAVVSGHKMAGAISGYCKVSRFIDCIIECNVYAFRSAGGLIGYAEQVEMNGCGSRGMVSTGYNDCGGLIGTWGYGGTMANSSSICQVNANNLAGLLCGTVYSSSTMENCYANGILNAGFWSGGISGNSHGLHIKNCYTTLSITDMGYLINGGSPAGILTGCTDSVTADHTYFPAENTIPAASTNDVGILGVNSFSDTASFFSDSFQTFTHPIFVGGNAQTNLLNALNAWVDENNTGRRYYHWRADTANMNGGFPILEKPACPVVPRTYINQRTHACESYTFNNVTYTDNSSISDTLLDANGCDSISIRLILIHHPVQGYEDVHICRGQSYTFNGRTVTEPGNYYDTIYNGSVYGCDSIASLWLDVQNAASWLDVRVCEGQSYTFNGRTLTETNEYYDTIFNGSVYGCDSIVYLWLEVRNPTSVNTARICEGQSYSFNGRTLTEMDSYYDTIPNGAANGCDSIAYLWLEVRNNYSYPSAETCQGSPFSFAGQMLTESGTYYDTLTNVSPNGCDSIVELNLTVHPSYNLYDTVIVPVNALPYLFIYEDWGPAPDFFNVIMTNGTQVIDTRTNPSGTIYDNGGPDGNYSNYFDGTIILTADPGATINLRGNYHLEGCCDYIAVYDGYGTSGNALVNTVGNSDGNVDVQSNTGYLTIQFTSDVSVNYGGFALQWNTHQSIDTLLTAAGDYTFEAHTLYGCNNTINLHLEHRTPYSRTDSVSVCSNTLPYAYADTLIADAGTYTFFYLDRYGIDSTVTLVLDVKPTSSSSEVVTACDSFTWWNTNYTNSTNSATHVLTNAAGCDSVVTLHLTINPSTSGDTTVTACESFTWQGMTYSVSGDVHGGTPLQNAAGCDSVVTLHLTINNPAHTASTETACDSYIWNGTTYEASGDYTYSHTDANGCSQVDTLHLTINNSTTGDTTVTACESFTWQGTTYSVSGDVHGGTPLQNAAGCDSVVTLHLTINNSTTGDTTVTACECFTWQGTTYSVSGDVHGGTPLQNAAGCDSVVTLHLTINHSVVMYDSITIASTELPYDYHGNTINEEGDHTFNGTTVGGCDSTLHLHVVVNQVGIDDNQRTESEIQLYPNPTGGVLTVAAEGIKSIEVMDVVGRKLMVHDCLSDNETIDLSTLPNGAYTLRIVTHDQTYIRKVVKK
jgi:hypothetical protein